MLAAIDGPCVLSAIVGVGVADELGHSGRDGRVERRGKIVGPSPAPGSFPVTHAIAPLEDPLPPQDAHSLVEQRMP